MSHGLIHLLSALFIGVLFGFICTLLVVCWEGKTSESQISELQNRLTLRFWICSTAIISALVWWLGK